MDSVQIVTYFIPYYKDIRFHLHPKCMNENLLLLQISISAQCVSFTSEKLGVIMPFNKCFQSIVTSHF
ncbi:hypothetical protein [Lysinibacillus telephonicus]|uniref:hypothetical protein n=1 Tax=Lysinibacillus telephonicus TaxID=1714840 RepID=UPI00397AC1D6